MRDNKLHTPDGVMDYLPEQYYIKTEIERRIETVFQRYGYSCLSSPMYEYVEVFDAISSVNKNQMVKFLDRDGSILALRSDMTPVIARIVATVYKTEDIPIRLCYFENTFRYNESYQGKLKEFTQAGIELIGASSDDSTAEVIGVAVNCLIMSGLEGFRIDLGQVEFFNGVIEEAGFDDEIALEIQKHIVNRDFVAVEKIVKGKEMPEGVKTVLSEFPLLMGGKEILLKARGLVTNKRAISALDNLENIYEILCDYGAEKYVSFDLSMIGHQGYYTGVIFRGYAHGAGISLVDGGRYDNLLSNFGLDYPSVGFAIKINALTSALESQNYKMDIPKADTLIAYSKEGRKEALKTADSLRMQGLFIENSVIGYDFKENIDYAKERNLGGVIYFKDSENIIVTDTVSNVSKEITISELLGKTV